MKYHNEGKVRADLFNKAFVVLSSFSRNEGSELHWFSDSEWNAFADRVTHRLYNPVQYREPL